MTNITSRSLCVRALCVILAAGTPPAPGPVRAASPTRDESAATSPASAVPLVYAPAAPPTLQLVAPAAKVPSNIPAFVELRATGAVSLTAWEFDLSFDPSLLDVTLLQTAPFFGQPKPCAPASARCGFALGPMVVSGTASVGGLSYGSAAPATGSGVLAYLRLTPKGKPGTSPLVMTGALVMAEGTSYAPNVISASITFGPPARAYVPSTRKGGNALWSPAKRPAFEPVAAEDAAPGHAPGAWAPLTPGCSPIDANCDGVIDIRDLQPIASSYGAVSGTQAYSDTVDVNSDGVIDDADLTDAAPVWRTNLNALNGLPRLGYAVDGAGGVFLRWTAPISPYAATTYVWRQTAGMTQPAAIAALDPITSDAVALPLLGSAWDVLKVSVSYTTDITGAVVPVTLTSVSQMHDALRSGRGNPMVVNQLMNQTPGVAQVMARGHADVVSPTGVVTYWVSARGRFLGPLAVNAVTRTVLAPPRDLMVFTGTVNIAPAAAPRERAKQQREMDGALFLWWRAPNMPAQTPLWMFGYDVFRRSCDPNMTNCTAKSRINDLPVQPRPAPVTATQVITNSSNPSVTLVYGGNEPHEFVFNYADRGLDTAKLHCYTVAARDLLGQPGQTTAEACLQAPDFKGPDAPRPIWAGVHGGRDPVCTPRALVSWELVQDAERYEVYRQEPPRGAETQAWELVAAFPRPTVLVSTTGQFNATGSYTFYRPVSGTLAVTYAISNNSLTVTNSHPSLPSAQMLPQFLLNNENTTQRGGQSANSTRSAAYVIDGDVARGERYRYRVLGIDARGNVGPNSPGAEVIIKPWTGECLPAKPAIGQPVGDAAFVRIYRKFGDAGQPLMLTRVPSSTWNANPTPTDYFSPTVEMNVNYEIRSENEYGELSAPSAIITRSLVRAISLTTPTPIIVEATLVRGNAEGRAHGVVAWSMSGGSALGLGGVVNIYRKVGVTMPATVANMNLVATGTLASFAVGSGVTRTYAFTDTAPSLRTRNIYWYAVEFDPKLGASKAGTPRAAYFVPRAGEPERDVETLNGTGTLNFTLGPDDGVLVNWSGSDAAADTCCFVVMRKLADVDGWTQVTPPLVGYEYYDSDQAVSDPIARNLDGRHTQYQVLRIDAGDWTGSNVNQAEATGEIIAASKVQTFTRSVVAPGTLYYMPGTPPTQTFTSPNLPEQLKFGNWTVEVNHYTGWAPVAPFERNMSGWGSAFVRMGAGDVMARVRVDFSGITSTAAGVVTEVRSIDSAIVQLGVPSTQEDPGECYRVDHADRVKYLLCDTRLITSGAVVKQLYLLSLGDTLVTWDYAAGKGDNTRPVFNLHPLESPFLDWEEKGTASACMGNPNAMPDLVAHTQYPVFIVPTGPMTYTERGVQWTSVCTRYRIDRYSASVSPGGAPVTGALDGYDINGFLVPSYTSPSARYVFTQGLTVALTSTTPHTYTSAYPFGFVISSNQRTLNFAGGTLSGGALRSGAIGFEHARQTNMTQRRTFAGVFSSLQLERNGAFGGEITGTTPVTWATFSFTGTNRPYDLYLPPALAPGEPKIALPADKGDASTGLTVTGLPAEFNAGLNAYQRGLVWNVCPAPVGGYGLSSTTTITFPKTAASGFKLYFRRSGANGNVNMVPDVPAVANVAGYPITITRFSQSWLNTGPHSGAGTGRLRIPYPAELALDYIGLSVDAAGCMFGGAVLPTPGTLAYWDIDVTPTAAEFRTEGGSTNVWIAGSYSIPHLTRVDGGADDPSIEIETSFKPNGNFYASEAYAQPSVYEMDGFYTVMEELRLSDCWVGPGEPNVITQCNGEAPPFNPNVTTRPSISTTSKGFIDLTAGVYFPWFGEVISTTGTHIYLQGRGANSYIGFNKRPRIEGMMAQKTPVTLTLDLAYAQAPTTSTLDSRWIGVAKVSQRDLNMFTMPYAAVITPDRTTVVMGFPAMAAAMQAAFDIDREWDGTPATAAHGAKFTSYRAKLGVGASTYLTEVVDAVALADVLDATTFDAIVPALDAALGDEESDAAAWFSANGLGGAATLTQRFAVLGKYMANSPVQLKYPRGSVSLLGIRDEEGRLIDATTGVLSLSAVQKVFLNPTGAGAPDGNLEALLNSAANLALDSLKGKIVIERDNVPVSPFGQTAGGATMDLSLELYLGGDDGYGLHGNINIEGLSFAVATVDKATGVFGFTIDAQTGQMTELYVGFDVDTTFQTGAWGPIVVGGSMLMGRLDPGHPTLQADYGDLFDDMNAQPGEIIKGLYMSVYANNIPLVQIGAFPCVLVGLSGGASFGFWVFSNADDTDTAWGTRIGGFVVGDAACGLLNAAASVQVTLDNDFGENGTELTGDVFIAAGCGVSCNPETWVDEAAFLADEGLWCTRCGISVTFVVPLDGRAPYMRPEPSFACELL